MEENQQEFNMADFQNVSSQADLLAQRGSFLEAIEAYTVALNMKKDKHCLTARAKCFIQIGQPDMALKDANESLKDDPTFFKGIFLKAEALYAQGDFELALLNYHRGNQLRPELAEFRIGISKASEAIDNAIGNKDVKIRVPNKVRKLFQQNTDKPFHVPTHVTPVTEARLLGELWQDKQFLTDMLNDKDLIDNPHEKVTTLVKGGLKYLEARLEFWRQEHPLRNKSH